MNRKTLIVSILVVVALVFTGAALLLRPEPPAPSGAELPAGSPLVRFGAPILGPESAPVTVVEFFDPACEACRAFHPVIKEIRERYPEDVRVVLRYAAFHDGSAEALGILEAARRQQLFEPVLEALLEAQPVWANHGQPRIDAAWEAAAAAGLDLDRAREDATAPEVLARLDQERADVETIGVAQTPTFFVDGRPLMDFGAEQLLEMVRTQVEARGT